MTRPSTIFSIQMGRPLSREFLFPATSRGRCRGEEGERKREEVGEVEICWEMRKGREGGRGRRQTERQIGGGGRDKSTSKQKCKSCLWPGGAG